MYEKIYLYYGRMETTALIVMEIREQNVISNEENKYVYFLL
jgi:hypothetical protein